MPTAVVNGRQSRYLIYDWGLGMGSPAAMCESLSDGCPETLVREQLERILASAAFSRSERLSAFLGFIVSETLAGRGASLKEQVIAAELYEKSPAAARDDSSIVRADARRLRDKLREYYAEAAGDPVLISLPKGSYTPTLERIAVAVFAPDAETIAEVRPARGRTWWLLGALAVGVVAALALWRGAKEAAQPLHLKQVTAYPGEENNPSLSPDGNFVAFAWSGSEKTGPRDIWVKAVDGEALHRVTDTEANEDNPAWSPDGKEIVFGRQRAGVFIVSPLGGPERQISSSGTNPKWTPDGNSVLIRDRTDPRSPAGIFQVDLNTLERRQITQPRSGNGDWQFEVSPDGRTVAFSRSDRSGVADIYTVPITGGEPKRITNWSAPMYGVTWSRDGRDLIFAVAGQPLLRIPARTTHPGKGEPVHVSNALVGGPFNPHLSRPAPGSAARLVFEARMRDISLRSIDLESPLRDGFLPVASLLDATRVDVPGAISQTGEKFAFRAYFHGWQLWVASRSGRDLRQLTPVGAYMVEMGGWSPDGRQVVFDAAVDGNSDLYVVSESGGTPKRLTSEPSIELRARFSRDGNWIYYSSNRTGRYEIWRMPAGGGPSTPITQSGGFDPFESEDGGSLYYLDQPPVEGVIALGFAKLKTVPANGGEETVLLDMVLSGAWGVTSRGVLFLSPDADSDSIKCYADGQVTSLGRLPFRVSRAGFGRVVFSPDGRWALTNQDDRADSDVMVIDNFR